jgi:6-phosphogluconolactonase (cycloisomerase 2 family)
LRSALTGTRRTWSDKGAYQVAISSDGRFLYLASWTENGVSLFRVAF